jgi:hypothetical protein
MKYRREQLLKNPLQLPNFLELVWPYPGSSISLNEYKLASNLKRNSSICIRIAESVTGGKWNVILEPDSEPFSLFINSKSPGEYTPMEYT